MLPTHNCAVEDTLNNLVYGSNELLSVSLDHGSLSRDKTFSAIKLVQRKKKRRLGPRRSIFGQWFATLNLP